MHRCGVAAGGSRECVWEMRVLTVVWGNICVGRLDGGEMAWVGVVVSGGVWWGFSEVSGIGGVGTGGGVVVMMLW